MHNLHSSSVCIFVVDIMIYFLHDTRKKAHCWLLYAFCLVFFAFYFVIFVMQGWVRGMMGCHISVMACGSVIDVLDIDID